MERRAATVALLMRHGAVVIVAVVMLADPADTAAPQGKLLLLGLGLWSGYRLLTRSYSAAVTAADYIATVAVCLAIPLLVSTPDFYRSNSAPVAIVGTAVVTYGISLPSAVSGAMTGLLAAAYAIGAARVTGWDHVDEIFNLYYFGLQWAASTVMRYLVVRVTRAVDTARRDRISAEVAEEVGAAVREYDREQTRLLHDTVASTLLLVGQGTPIPADRLAAQAARDLDVLGDGPHTAPRHSVELVAALRDLTVHLRTPARLDGVRTRWVDGTTAAPVIAAAREALNNVDRHARAGLVRIGVHRNSIVITDDGTGFDCTAPSAGHGLSASIRGRMTQLGGHATVTSTPGNGTVVQLSWPTGQQPELRATTDPDRLIERIRLGYGLVLVGYGVLNLAAVLPTALIPATHPGLQIGLAVVAAVCTLSALPVIISMRTAPVIPAAVVLMAVALTQTMLVPTDLIGGQVQWSQNAIGWCLMPLLLRVPSRTARRLLALYWLAPAAIGLLRDPSAHTLVNIGLGTASILTVQLCVLLFNTLIQDAAASAHRETAMRRTVLAQERTAQALQDEYRRRYRDLIANVRPLLTALTRQQPVDAEFRRQAQLETQRMRMLFDQSASFEHALLQALRPAIDAAEDRGVDVSVHIDGTLPEIDTHHAMAAVIAQALSATSDSARIAFSTESGAVTASIVCRGVTDDVVPIGTAEMTVIADTVWLTVDSTNQQGAHHDADTVSA